ncbi:hypothetical protein ACOSQ4_000855 [Xanthoceras sorbifolium]
MNRDMGLFLGGLIGAVQEIDGGDSGDCLGKFLRVRVLINVQQPLKRGLRFAFGAGGEVCSALLCYERLPNFCFYCGCMGHLLRECHVNKLGVLEAAELKFGGWLRAPNAGRLKFARGTRTASEDDPSSGKHGVAMKGNKEQAADKGVEEPPCNIPDCGKREKEPRKREKRREKREEEEERREKKKKEKKRKRRRREKRRKRKKGKGKRDRGTAISRTKNGTEVGVLLFSKSFREVFHMKILCWNVRGLGNPRTFRALRARVREDKPEMIFLSETRLNSFGAGNIRVHLGFDGCFVVDRVGTGGGLILLWQISVDVSVRSFNCGHIDCVVSDADGRKWRFTGFYGEPKQWLREQSWVLLRRLAGLDNLPWLIGGDFNEILRGDEKEGGLARMGSAMDGFREAVDSCNLLDMGFSGSKFTWCNRQFGGNVIWERLDRCFCNIQWRTLFSGAVVVHRDFSGSDHRALVIENICKQTVTVNLGDWNRKKKKASLAELRSLKDELEALYGRSQDRGVTGRIVSVEQQIDGIYDRLEQFWRQRSRAMWLKDGDRNTRFFHSKATQRRRRNRIMGLMGDDGRWRDKIEEIEREVVDFYSELFSSGAEHPGSMEEVLSCVEGKVSEEMNMGLSRMFTGDEVLRALKHMDPLKAPGLDGLPVLSFQNVAGLLSVGGVWNEELVRCSFLPEEAEIILSIQLSSASCQDSLLWHYDKRGEFTVRSAYKLAAEAFGKNIGSSSAGPDPWWKALWSLHIPSKVKFFGWKVCKNILPTRGCLKSRKSIDHILWSCVKVNVLWKGCPFFEGLNKLKVGVFVDRLSWVVSGLGKESAAIFLLAAWASAYFSDFQSATTSGLSNSSTPKQLWSRPPDGVFKLNVDASVVSGLGCYGVGLIIRDDSGFPVLVKSQLCSGSISVEVAEARAILEGVSLAVELAFFPLFIEVAAFSFVPRCSNSIADFLTKEALRLRASFLWKDLFPDWFVIMVQTDVFPVFA